MYTPFRHFHQRFHASTNFKFPEWLNSPDCHQKWDWGAALLPSPICARLSHAWALFNFELMEGQSVNEVFAGVQEAGPLAGVVRGQRPLLKKILHLVGIRYAISLPIFVKKLINTHTKLLRKNMVRHRKPAFENDRKTDDPPFSSSKKS